MKGMHSLKAKITMLTVWITVVAVAVVTLLSVLFIRDAEHSKSDQLQNLTNFCFCCVKRENGIWTITSTASKSR